MSSSSGLYDHARTIRQAASSLTVKALLMLDYKPQRVPAANVKFMLNAPAGSFTHQQFRNANAELMDARNAETDEDLSDQLTMTEVPLGQQILALKAAPLEKKREVLATMPIIDNHNAAIFLGMTSPGFNQFVAIHRDIFGAEYMGARHYSVSELILIATNPEWTASPPSRVHKATALDYTQFDYGTVVEEKVAMAFCNITRNELPKAAYATGSGIRTYGLSDLEKIRVTELKAQQH